MTEPHNLQPKADPSTATEETPSRYKLFSREWWGFGKAGKKTGLDLLQVVVALSALSIPIVVAYVANQYTESQRAAQQQVEEQRAQDTTLQSYFDQMSTLLIDEDLRHSEKDSEPRQLARARTLTVLRRLDGERKASALRFLQEAGLVERPVENFREATITEMLEATNPIVSLMEADLTGADLTEARLNHTDLSHTYLTDANMTHTQLVGAHLRGADLTGATLPHVLLTAAWLGGTHLAGAALLDADLLDADLTGADLTDARLSLAKNLSQDQIEQARGNKRTELPWGLRRPEAWTENKQVEPFGLLQVMLVLSVLVLLLLLTGRVFWVVHRNPSK